MQGLNTLTANIRREWLARILDGSKKIESFCCGVGISWSSGREQSWNRYLEILVLAHLLSVNG